MKLLIFGNAFYLTPSTDVYGYPLRYSAKQLAESGKQILGTYILSIALLFWDGTVYTIVQKTHQCDCPSNLEQNPLRMSNTTRT